MESKCRQWLLDNVYNLGYATAANVAAGAGCCEADASRVLAAAFSPKEFLLLAVAPENSQAHGLAMRLTLCPSLKELNATGVHVLAAVSHSFINVHSSDPAALWTAIAVKECAEMLTNQLYSTLHSTVTAETIRSNMERRDRQLQLSDDDLVRYSAELFYAVARSDARMQPREKDTKTGTVPLIPVILDTPDEPVMKKTALQGVAATVVSRPVVDESGVLTTVHKEVPVRPKADSAMQPATKKKQKVAACDLMAFVKKRE